MGSVNVPEELVNAALTTPALALRSVPLGYETKTGMLTKDNGSTFELVCAKLNLNRAMTTLVVVENSPPFPKVSSTVSEIEYSPSVAFSATGYRPLQVWLVGV